jgi:hypothetical protein
MLARKCGAASNLITAKGERWSGSGNTSTTSWRRWRGPADSYSGVIIKPAAAERAGSR